MEALKTINFIITLLFFVCYAYQFAYIPVPLLRKASKHLPDPLPSARNYAVLICARNEERVIGDLIRSLRRQTYDPALLHLFVMADNCTDRTAEAAREAGAEVYTRQNTLLVGKGYALTELMSRLKEDYPEGFDGFFVFDADNLLEPDYVEQMDRLFTRGHHIITGYRNSKNYGHNWISAGYSLWFLRESRYLNHPRYLLGTSCSVSGTGFLFSRQVAEELDGWPYHLLTEDIEFTVDQVLRGRKIAFCPDAVLYDEQPVRFSQSWRQRLRWSRGYLQVFRRYGGRLLKGIFRGSFSCFDLSMTILPAFVLSGISVLCNVITCIVGAAAGGSITEALLSAGQFLLSMYLALFFWGAVTTVTEWKRIRTSAAKKLLYTLTFPLFMFTYLPIAAASLFGKVTWKPIEHTVSAASAEAELRVK